MSSECCNVRLLMSSECASKQRGLVSHEHLASYTRPCVMTNMLSTHRVLSRLKTHAGQDGVGSSMARREGTCIAGSCVPIKTSIFITRDIGNVGVELKLGSTRNARYAYLQFVPSQERQDELFAIPLHARCPYNGYRHKMTCSVQWVLSQHDLFLTLESPDHELDPPNSPRYNQINHQIDLATALEIS